MPLFLRSLPLSLGTLWHYVFLLPLVIIFCTPFVLLTLIPLIGLIVAPAMGAFVTFAGYRCALTARGRGNEPALGKLVRASLFYGFMNTLVGAVFLLLSVGVVMVLAKLGIQPSLTMASSPDIPWVPGLAIIALFVLNTLFTCAIAVPMTAVAAAASPGRRDPGPFVGFGRGMVSLTLVWIAWFGGIFLFGFFDILSESVTFAMQNTMGNLRGKLSNDVPDFHLIPFIAAVTYLIWGSCWFYATAVLVWERHLSRQEAQKVETVAVERMTAEDLRALREARMQRNEGPLP